LVRGAKPAPAAGERLAVPKRPLTSHDGMLLNILQTHGCRFYFILLKKKNRLRQQTDDKDLVFQVE
jgi:hypothetical protein